jgi:L-asparaginase
MTPSPIRFSRQSTARSAGFALVMLLTLAATSTGSTRSETGEPAQLPHVVVLSTGGTIASTTDPVTGALKAALTGEEVVAAVPGLAELARVSVEQVAQVGSKDMTPSIWRVLAARANELLADPGIAGVVITHGTDTLEETAYFLDLTVTSDKPVVVVGAQRAPTYFDTDGPRNLLDAIRVAISDEALGMGTLVVMNGQINAARDVTKTNTLDVETFRTPDFGALGVADVEAVRFYRAPLRRQSIPIDASVRLPRVAIVPMYAGADGRMIELLLENDEIDGLVIEGLGLAHVPEAAMDAVRAVRARGVPVALSTRVHTGRIVPLYANNVALLEMGCVEADNLTAQKARILLMLAMTRTRDSEELQAYFDR